MTCKIIYYYVFMVVFSILLQVSVANPKLCFQPKNVTKLVIIASRKFDPDTNGYVNVEEKKVSYDIVNYPICCPGYKGSVEKCESACEPECSPNSFCAEDKKCHCRFGYNEVITSKNNAIICKPQCEHCRFGNCVGFNVCQCWWGFELNGNICQLSLTFWLVIFCVTVSVMIAVAIILLYLAPRQDMRDMNQTSLVEL